MLTKSSYTLQSIARRYNLVCKYYVLRAPLLASAFLAINPNLNLNTYYFRDHAPHIHSTFSQVPGSRSYTPQTFATKPALTTRERSPRGSHQHEPGLQLTRQQRARGNTGCLEMPSQPPLARWLEAATALNALSAAWMPSIPKN